MVESESDNELRLLVVADDSLARAGLAALVAGQAGCIVVGRTSGTEKFLEELEVYRPDVVVWDLGLDPALSLGRIETFRDSAIPIIALAPNQHAAGQGVARGIRCILSRNVERRTLLAAVRAASEGLTVVDSDFAEGLLSHKAVFPERPAEPLTPRELEVLQLLASGMPNKSIASQMGVSEHTVKFHVNSILTKLGAQSRTEAVARGTRLGLITL